MDEQDGRTQEQPRREVVAKKSKTMTYIAILVPFILAGFMVYVVKNTIMLGDESPMGMPGLTVFSWVLFLASVALCCYVLYIIILLIRTPQEIVVVTGDKFEFCGKGGYLLSDIASVEYRRNWARGFAYPFGRLRIRLKNGKLLQNRFVAEVERVHNRLYELMRSRTEHSQDGENT